jgi:hypothetical protein
MSDGMQELTRPLVVGRRIDESNSSGHHIERHADGGKTDSANHAEVCLECHAKIHGRKPDQ